MGMVKGLPVGLSFIGPKWSDGLLLSLGHAFELARGPFPAPALLPSIESAPPVAGLLAVATGWNLAALPAPALGWPVFVKPSRAGSSFGITKVDDWAQLDAPDRSGDGRRVPRRSQPSPRGGSRPCRAAAGRS